MTALHRRWLDCGDVSAREQITVLNLRHGLSAGHGRARSAGLAPGAGNLNVNRVLDRRTRRRLRLARHAGLPRADCDTQL